MWKGHQTLQERLFWTDEDSPILEGTEFTIGFVRGTTRGGDWGVNYVRKPIKDYTSTFTDGPNTFCYGVNGAPPCQTDTYTSTTSTSNVLVEGIEVHFFVPLYRFANRVQLGVGVGGGVGFSSGTSAGSSTYTNHNHSAGQAARDRNLRRQL
jgi:hypothetical protein